MIKIIFDVFGIGLPSIVLITYYAYAGGGRRSAVELYFAPLLLIILGLFMWTSALYSIISCAYLIGVYAGFRITNPRNFVSVLRVALPALSLADMCYAVVSLVHKS